MIRKDTSDGYVRWTHYYTGEDVVAINLEHLPSHLSVLWTRSEPGGDLQKLRLQIMEKLLELIKLETSTSADASKESSS